MGLPPEETIPESEVSEDDITTDEPEGVIQATPEDYEIEEENLKDNEWIDRDYGDDPDDVMTQEEVDELENLPDGDFDEDAGF